MLNMVRRLDALPHWLQVVLSASMQAGPFYAAALLSKHIESVAAQASVPAVLADAAVVVVLLTLVLAVRAYFDAVRREANANAEKRRAVIARAHDLVDRIVAQSLAELSDASGAADAALLFGSRTALNRIIQAVYELFEGAFGGGGDASVNFEATFMARSYRDGLLTIPAHANKDARAPVSLQQRERNPKIYEQTVSALVHQQESPSPRLIADTERDPAYNALYEGQKRRIRSSIVYPVRNAANGILGTIVVHCDKAGFFDPADEKYWTSVLEVFSKRVAVEKAKMDRLMTRRESGEARVEVVVPESPF